MTKAQQWNWTLVVSAILLIVVGLKLNFYRSIYHAAGGVPNTTSTGLAAIGLPILLSPILFGAAGWVSFWLKCSRPLVVALLGLALYYPLFFIVIFLSNLVGKIAPDAKIVILPVVGVVLLLFAFKNLRRLYP